MKSKKSGGKSKKNTFEENAKVYINNPLPNKGVNLIKKNQNNNRIMRKTKFLKGNSLSKEKNEKLKYK